MKSNKLYERALITCIIMLFICILFKLFGFNYFNLNTDIPILKEIDNVVMNSAPLSFLYSLIFMTINGYLICIIVLNNHKINILWFVINGAISILISVSKFNCISPYYDTISLCIICLILSKKISIIGSYAEVCLLNIVYQCISIFIRNLSIDSNFVPLFIGALMNLDYYIMLIITYLYMRKGEVLCSVNHRIGFSLANLLWKKHSENYLNKKGK